jgi:hypothetical protein
MTGSAGEGALSSRTGEGGGGGTAIQLYFTFTVTLSVTFTVTLTESISLKKMVYNATHIYNPPLTKYIKKTLLELLKSLCEINLTLQK